MSNGDAKDTIVFNEYKNQEPRVSSPIRYPLPKLSSLPDKSKVNENMNSSFNKNFHRHSSFVPAWPSTKELRLLTSSFHNLTSQTMLLCLYILYRRSSSTVGKYFSPAHAFLRQVKMQSDLATRSVLQTETSKTKPVNVWTYYTSFWSTICLLISTQNEHQLLICRTQTCVCLTLILSTDGVNLKKINL